jgi:hypothetical protein
VQFFVGMFFLGVDMVLFGLHCDLTKSDWAAWVQAIGSIVTIVVAWAIVQHQLSHGERSRDVESRRADKTHAEIGLRLSKDVYGIVMNVHSKFDLHQRTAPNVCRKIATERMEEMQRSLHNFTLKPVPPMLYAEILVLIRELAFTQTAVRQQNDRATINAQRAKRALKRANTVLKCRDRIAAMVTGA